MSTPAFAPGLVSHLPTRLNQPTATSTSHNQAHDSTSTNWNATAALQHQFAAAQLAHHSSSNSSNNHNSQNQQQCSPQSAASSATSSTDSTSPRSDVLANSALRGTLGLTTSNATLESFSSAATTASPASSAHASLSDRSAECVRMDEDAAAPTPATSDQPANATATPAASTSRAMAGLSVQENEPSATSKASPLSVDTSDEMRATATSKTRRASVLSSSSAQHPEEGAWMSGSKSGRDALPARKKAPRMGSFEARTGSDGFGMTRMDQQQQQQQQQSHATTASSSRSSSGSGSVRRERVPTGPEVSMSAGPSTLPAPSVQQQVQASPSQQSQQHVDMVNYPSTELLKLLASLLEQIAHANDALHQRTHASRSGSSSPRAPGAYSNESMSSFHNGRFDAAPLNSPATPRYRSTAAETREDDSQQQEMPVTPGVDLLREVGAGGGVQGFMPSLGGTHQPQPLSRRRGSSFLRRREDGPSPSISRRTSTAMVEVGPTAASAAPSYGNSAGGHNAQSHAAGSNHSSGSSSPDAPLSALFTASSQALSSPSATLCFHARNVPAISIEAYLLRILKYCPTTNEVFLSLLVYFDRMARVGLEAQRAGIAPVSSNARGGSSGGSGSSVGGADNEASSSSRLFAIDSFNVHRLVIAGVTVASKFFSDVFYTNSRYAKVGGLPLTELNQLELQFLLLNDFRLVVPVDELQRYADQLILFWVGRNGQQQQQAGTPVAQPSPRQQIQQQSRPETPLPSHTPNAAASQSHDAAHQTSSRSSGVDSSVEGHSSQQQQQHQPSSRPRSVRSQPSSSGTSVTSTITPGTPASARQHQFEDGSDGQEEADEDDEHETGSRFENVEKRDTSGSSRQQSTERRYEAMDQD
ncbi:hypothetical protein ACM66B_006357 [Microbotryomycetes sp. NB124-2]